MQTNYEFTTCSNKLTIKYHTTGKSALSQYYRGFRSYYELVDVPSTCSNAVITVATTTTAIVPTYPATGEVFSTITGTDQLGGLRPCVLPFKSDNTMNDECLLDSSTNEYWCSLTSDYNVNKERVINSYFLPFNIGWS